MCAAGQFSGPAQAVPRRSATAADRGTITAVSTGACVTGGPSRSTRAASSATRPTAFCQSGGSSLARPGISATRRTAAPGPVPSTPCATGLTGRGAALRWRGPVRRSRLCRLSRCRCVILGRRGRRSFTGTAAAAGSGRPGSGPGLAGAGENVEILIVLSWAPGSDTLDLHEPLHQHPRPVASAPARAAGPSTRRQRGPALARAGLPCSCQRRVAVTRSSRRGHGCSRFRG